ncbi:golgin subfamily A member 6-like protein 22 [Copidosoma floridanum]|uniref:golgin subfamily A member 6-like protein 22 n=1 Tax=Copidosoma floridanum TaxID=29053 RepID=UPI0006C9800A|nr:golgin subfamily A member 6-like protein 22 [Copidosoma floridanum]
MWIEEKQQWIEEKKALEERISKLEWETEKAGREKRRPNIVIKGASIEGENLEKKVEEYIEQKIKVKVKIEKAKEISVNAGQNVRKLVVVRLAKTWLKQDKWAYAERGWINKSDSESDSDEKDVRLRKSKDEKINEEGRRLIKEITEEVWCIVNGQKEEEGEFTYVGSRGESVIDYAIVCQEAFDQIKEMKIGQRTESDHMPLEVYLEKEVEYGERCKDWERKGKEVEERWSELKEKIESAVPKVQKECKVWKMRDKKWHDKEWKEKKDLRRIMKREEARKDEARTNAVDQEEMSKEEFERQIARLKVGKAPGEDKLENEVWKYMPGKVDAALWELLKKVWKKEELPDQWRQAYKIYASMLNEMLKKEIEGKLSESQFGFREKKGVIEAICTLKQIVEEKLCKEREKLFTCFIDLKEAFDRVDRKVLKERLIEMEVSEKLRNRIMDISKETKHVVEVGEEESKEFWTEKGVRQGCPLSPTLFNVYLVDLEQELKKGQVGGCRVALVENIALFGAEVWDWEEEESLESVQRRYMKWILGLDSNTPNYIVEKECGLERMKAEPEYLKKDMPLKDRKLVVRFRCGNECRSREYWKGEEDKKFRLCKEEEEDLSTY